jgi:hypothetical protein
VRRIPAAKFCVDERAAPARVLAAGGAGLNMRPRRLSATIDRAGDRDQRREQNAAGERRVRARCAAAGAGRGPGRNDRHARVGSEITVPRRRATNCAAAAIVNLLPDSPSFLCDP